jgi:hypothetical protein
MKIRNLGLLAAISVSVVFVVVACSSTEGDGTSGADSGTTGEGGSDGGDGSDGSDGSVADGGVDGAVAPDKCAVASGQYTSHYTSATGTTSCQKPPDSSFTIDPNDSGDAGPSCTVTKDAATCTTTAECSITSTSGNTTKSKSVIKNVAGAVTGTQTLKTTKSDGSVLVDCTYEFTWTKV